MSNEIYEKLEICRKSILQKTNFKPEVAVILGSGLGEYASKIKIEQIIPYTEIEGFPVSTVVGHKGQFVFGYVKEVPVVIIRSSGKSLFIHNTSAGKVKFFQIFIQTCTVF